MNSTLLNGIIDTVKKQMPAIQAEELINTLNEFQKTAAKLDEMTNKYNDSIKLVVKLEDEKAALTTKVDNFQKQLSDIEGKEKQLLDKEINLGKREREFDNEILKVKLSAQVSNNSNMFELMRIAFHSPVYQSMVEGHVTTRDKYNNTIIAPYHQVSTQKAVDGNEHMHFDVDGKPTQLNDIG